MSALPGHPNRHRPPKGELFAICMPALIIIVAMCNLCRSGDHTAISTPGSPARVILVRRVPIDQVEESSTEAGAINSECDRDDVGQFDPTPGWPYTAGWK